MIKTSQQYYDNKERKTKNISDLKQYIKTSDEPQNDTKVKHKIQKQKYNTKYHPKIPQKGRAQKRTTIAQQSYNHHATKQH